MCNSTPSIFLYAPGLLKSHAAHVASSTIADGCSLFVRMMFGYIAPTSRWYITGFSLRAGRSRKPINFSLISSHTCERKMLPRNHSSKGDLESRNGGQIGHNTIQILKLNTTIKQNSNVKIQSKNILKKVRQKHSLNLCMFLLISVQFVHRSS